MGVDGSGGAPPSPAFEYAGSAGGLGRKLEREVILPAVRLIDHGRLKSARRGRDPEQCDRCRRRRPGAYAETRTRRPVGIAERGKCRRPAATSGRFAAAILSSMVATHSAGVRLRSGPSRHPYARCMR